jgi:hypothetical protein
LRQSNASADDRILPVGISALDAFEVANLNSGLPVRATRDQSISDSVDAHRPLDLALDLPTALIVVA